MAERRRRSPYQTYRTYGNVAYAPAYDGNTVRVPKRQEEQRPAPRPGRRKLTRPQVRVRQAGAVAPFAVAGFLAVGVLAVLLLLSYVQLTLSFSSLSSLRGQLAELEEENAALTAQYEQVFDMEHLQAAVGSTMIRPTGDQITYIDLSEPDSVVVYGRQTEEEGKQEGIAGLFSTLIEYFR